VSDLLEGNQNIPTLDSYPDKAGTGIGLNGFVGFALQFKAF